MRFAITTFLLFYSLALASPAIAQSAQASVGIVQIEDMAKTGHADTFSTMIETAIVGTGRFRVIERERLGRLIQEQGRARSGVVTSRNRARVGGFEGVDYLVYGSITSVSVQARGGIGNALLGGVISGLMGRNGNVHCRDQSATISIDIRITDADTGEIRYVSRINETQRAASACGDQVQIDTAKLLRSTADRIASTLVTTIYPIQIAAVQADGTYVLNYGEGTVAPGAVMAVFSQGQAIRDPTTGQQIGHEEAKLGYVRVHEVTPRLSRASAVGQFSVPPPVGAVLRPASQEDVKAAAREERRTRSRR
jgi:curli biogenesis system outer membrane secretion channel CsgG